MYKTSFKGCFILGVFHQRIITPCPTQHQFLTPLSSKPLPKPHTPLPSKIRLLHFYHNHSHHRTNCIPGRLQPLLSLITTALIALPGQLQPLLSLSFIYAVATGAINTIYTLRISLTRLYIFCCCHSSQHSKQQSYVLLPCHYNRWLKRIICHSVVRFQLVKRISLDFFGASNEN